MRRLLKLLALLGLSAVPALGQGVIISPQPALRNNGLTVAAMVNATVTVCAANAMGLPCAPALVGQTFKDSALTLPLTDPFFTDQNGNYTFAIAPGQYTVTVTQFGQGYSYQVTAQCPLNGACTWSGNQVFNGNVTINGSCTGCGSGAPTGNNRSLQFNNSGVLGGANGLMTPEGTSLVAKGPEPWVDLQAFARYTPSYGCSPAITATISLSTPTTASLNNGACFQNGDGITIIGAGAANGLSTPTLSTITPASISSGGTALGGGTGTPINVVSGATGSSTYSYALIARDKFGGYSAASTPVSTTTGLSSLGAFSCTISTMTRSGYIMTINFSSACEGAVVGAMMEFSGGTGGEGFAGFYSVKTAPSSSQVTVVGSPNSANFGWTSTDQATTPNSSTGGTANFFSSNHLQWSVTGTLPWYYYVCAKRPGDTNYHLIGRTYPSSSVYEDLQFDDYGSPFNDSQKYPPYIETGSDTPNSNDAICTNATGLADPLTTTVSAGGGTTTLTLANAATTAVTSTSAVEDIGPGLIAAANRANTFVSPGNVYISPSTDGTNTWGLVNSYTKLPTNTVIHGAGTLIVNETIEEQVSTSWDGGWGSVSGLQFSYFGNGGESIVIGSAYPIFYISGAGVHNSNLTFSAQSNFNGQLIYVIDGSNVNLDNNQYDLSTGTNDNYLGMAIMSRGTGLSNPSVLDITRSLFLASTMTGTWPTATPYVYSPASQSAGACAGLQGGEVSFTNVSLYQRGFLQTTCNGGGENWYLKNVVRQSGFVPLLQLLSGSARAVSNVSLDNVTIDTGSGQYVATGNQVGNPGLIQLNITSRFLQGTGQYTGTTDYVDQYNGATGILPNGVGRIQECGTGGVANGAQVSQPMNCNFDYEAYIGSSAKIFSPQLSVPTAVSGTAVSGGTLGSGTFQVFVAANDLTGHSGLMSAGSSNVTTSGTCPGSGNCAISVGWTGVLGGGTYSIWACQVGAASTMPQCPTISNMTQTAAVTTNPATLSAVSGGSGAFQPPAFTLAGVSGFTSTAMWAPLLACPETAAPSFVVNYDIIYCDSGSHRLKFSNNAGSSDVIVGANTTDTLTNKTVSSGTISAGTFTGSGSGSGSILLTGIKDGLVPVNATTTTPCTFGTSGAGCFDQAYVTGYAFNQHATAAQAITYNLPTAVKGKQFCAANSNNGSAANTGVLTVATSAAGQFIIFTDGTLSASGGNVTSGGAAADAACFVGIDSTHWQQFTQAGTWTKH